MLAVYIISGIIALIIILLIIPLRINFVYSEFVLLNVKYLFINYQVYPEVKKKPSKPPAKKPSAKKPLPKKKENDLILKIKLIIKNHGVSGFLRLSREVLLLLTTSLRIIIKHVRVQELDICFTAAAEDAGDAALLYGEACAVIYPLVSFLAGKTGAKKYGVTVDMSHDLKEPTVLATARVKISPIFIVHHGIKLVFNGLFLINKIKET